MIYRKRVNKSSYECGPTKGGNFFKVAAGKRVWYFEIWPVFHTLLRLEDYCGYTVVTHQARKHRVTVDREDIEGLQVIAWAAGQGMFS